MHGFNDGKVAVDGSLLLRAEMFQMDLYITSFVLGFNSCSSRLHGGMRDNVAPNSQ